MNGLQKKIITITNELRAQKDGKNNFANYNYFKPDDLLNLLNPLLLKHDLFCKFNLTYKDSYYEAELILADDKEKEVYKFDILKATVKGANEAQNSGATLTYAKRYSLMNAFNIAENESDFDSDEHAKRELKAESKQPKKEPEPDYIGKIRILINEYQGADKQELSNSCAEAKKNNKFTKQFAEDMAKKLGGTL
jgi:hypothetical protein